MSGVTDHSLRSREAAGGGHHAHALPLEDEFLTGDEALRAAVRTPRSASAGAPRRRHTKREDEDHQSEQLETTRSPGTSQKRHAHLTARGSALLFSLIMVLLLVSGGLNAILIYSLLTAGSLSRGWTLLLPILKAAVPGWLHGAASSAVVSAWIAQRETTTFKAVLWVLAHLSLGSWATGLYVVRALWRMGTSWPSFWGLANKEH